MFKKLEICFTFEQDVEFLALKPQVKRGQTHAVKIM